MAPATKRRAAVAGLVVSLIGWPLSALTFAHNEPLTVLGLSWLAITLTMWDVYQTSDVRVEQDQEKHPDQ